MNEHGGRSISRRGGALRIGYRCLDGLSSRLSVSLELCTPTVMRISWAVRHSIRSEVPRSQRHVNPRFRAYVEDRSILGDAVKRSQNAEANLWSRSGKPTFFQKQEVFASLRDDCILTASLAIPDGKRDRLGRNNRKAAGVLACV